LSGDDEDLTNANVRNNSAGRSHVTDSAAYFDTIESPSGRRNVAVKRAFSWVVGEIAIRQTAHARHDVAAFLAYSACDENASGIALLALEDLIIQRRIQFDPGRLLGACRRGEKRDQRHP
jgi:hypothetical protein